MLRKTDLRKTVRFSEEEYALIVAKAGDKAISAFIREATLGSATTKRMHSQRSTGPNRKMLAQILALLAQHPIIRDFKAAAEQHEQDDDPKVDACHALLSEVRDLLFHALGKKP